MAFPYDIHANFEDGTRGVFDATTDTSSKLSIAHYSDLARTPGYAAPFRGAYCMRVDLGIAVDTNDAYIREDDNDLAVNATSNLRFYLKVDNMVFGDTDELIIFAARSAAAYEFVVSINFTTANGLRIGVGNETAAQLTALTQGVWHLVDLTINIDSGANNGDINWRIDGVAQTAVTGLTQIATTNMRLGAQDPVATMTSGVLLFDDFVLNDDGRAFGILPQDRFSDGVVLLASGHVFVGPGCIENATLLAGETADCGLRLWDTDVANTDGIENEKLLLRNTGTTGGEIVDPAGVPVEFKRGCYASLTGTADALGPWARLKIGSAVAYGSDGAIRSYGLRRPGGTAI